MANDRARIPVADLIASGDLVINDGYRAKNSELSKEGLPFARAQNIDNGFHFDGADCFPETDLAKVGIKVSQAGDVVFTSKGTVGRFALVRADTPRFVYAPQLCFWRSCNHDKISPRWLYYWMSSREFFVQFKGVSGQTDMAEYVSLRDQRAMHITLPEISVQRSIADVLGTLDDKIELNRRMNRTLERMAAAVFKSWFIDFDPVRRNIVRRHGQPSPPATLPLEKSQGEGSVAELPSPFGRMAGDEGCVEAFDSLFPDRFVDSELGEIPEGWTVAPLKDLAGVNAKSINKNYPHARIRYVDISSVSQGSLDQTTTYDLVDAPSRAKRLVQTGDTIWSCVRPNRKAYLYIDQPADNLVVSTGFAVLSPHTVPASYLYQWVTTQRFVDYLTAYATGAAYPAVKADTFEKAKMLRPTDGVLKAFHDLVGPLRARIAHNQRQNRRLAGLRDTLLPKLLSGEIELGEAEAIA
jgi:type I restriction enzyme S subunit